MDKQRFLNITTNVLKGAAATIAIGIVQEGLKNVQVGDRKIVLFTARK